MDETPPPAPVLSLGGLTLGVGLIAFVAMVWLFYFTADVLIPVAIALLIWSLINAIRAGIERISIFGAHPPGWFAMAAAIVLIIVGLYEFGAMVSDNVQDVSDAAPAYQANIERLVPQLLDLLGLDALSDLRSLVEDVNVAAIISSVAGTLSSFVGDAAIILIYVAFLLVEQQSFRGKIEAMFVTPARREEAAAVARQISEQIESYLRVKTVMSLLTAAVSFIILRTFGVDFAGFWAAVIFLLNYIPTVGSILGAIFPAVLTLVQFGDWERALLVLALLGFFAQFLISNIIEPRTMGTHLNLSPLVIILSLALWGSLWGVAGAFLCVPIMVIVMIVAAHFPQTRWLAVLMSSRGELIAEAAAMPPAEARTDPV